MHRHSIVDRRDTEPTRGVPFQGGGPEVLMRRREFIILAAGVWPQAARAQATKLPVVGYLSAASPNGFAPFITALREGLNERGLLHARDYVLEYRWAESEA